MIDRQYPFVRIVGRDLETFCDGERFNPQQAIYTLLKLDADESELSDADESEAKDENERYRNFTRLYKQRISRKLRVKLENFKMLVYPKKDPAPTAEPTVPTRDDGDASGENETNRGGENSDEERDQSNASHALEELPTPQSPNRASCHLPQHRGDVAARQRINDWENDSVISNDSADGGAVGNEKNEPKCNAVDIMLEDNAFDPDHDIVSLRFDAPQQHLVLWKCGHPLRLSFPNTVAKLKEKKQLPVHITCIVGFVNLYAEIGLLVQLGGFEGVRTITFLQPHVQERYQTLQCSLQLLLRLFSLS